MDRETLLDRLDKADWHVAIGETVIAAERARLERARREAGKRPIPAKEGSTLAQLEEIQALHLAARDQLLDEIRDCADAPTNPGGTHH